MSCNNGCFFLCLRLTLFYKRLQKFLNCLTRWQLTVEAFRNVQHHVWLIVTMVARCFSSLKSLWLLLPNGPAFFGNSKQLQGNDSVHLSSLDTDYSFSSCSWSLILFHKHTCSLKMLQSTDHVGTIMWKLDTSWDLSLHKLFLAHLWLCAVGVICTHYMNASVSSSSMHELDLVAHLWCHYQGMNKFNQPWPVAWFSVICKVLD